MPSHSLLLMRVCVFYVRICGVLNVLSDMYWLCGFARTRNRKRLSERVLLCFCAAQPLQSPWFWRLICHALTLSSSITAWMTPGSAHSGLGHKLRQYPCARPQTCAQCHDWCHSPGAWSCFSRTSLNGSVRSHISSTSFLKGKHDSLCCPRCEIHLQYPCLFPSLYHSVVPEGPSVHWRSRAAPAWNPQHCPLWNRVRPS